MDQKWMHVFFNDMQQYRGNLLLIKASRGVFIAFLLVILMPRDVKGFIHLLINSSNALLTTSQLSSLISILVFNGILLFSYLIQAKILPVAYNTNYIASIFDSLSVFISRAIFFLATNWFILVWILAGVILSPNVVSSVIILKILFVTLNISFTLSLMHEKRYFLLPILFLQLVIYAYLSDVVIISIANTVILLFLFSEIYKNDIKKIKLLRLFKRKFKPSIYHNFISGHQSLRVGILLRGNFLSSIGIGCTLIFFYEIFYHSLLSAEGQSTKIIWLYTLATLYLLSYVYAKLHLERKKIGCFLASISPRSTEVIHDFFFVFIIFEIVQILSIFSFPITQKWLHSLSFIVLPIPILALFCFLLTINNRNRKIYHFVSFCLIAWLILWIF
ncbi:hypothetical protein [Celerinatantimonas yamalensis]|uniref:Uncharacterized protein n=1 Tax=Celerinatantimonas yamalensis TaxID=559956 RepID=A0ABW9G3W7_9GAMM